ncbi:hypothetical protein CGRA01v4_04607 [Colletotrichum graminicola]|nr:hypothetical protein CGRA01v4_04607 [Colletotrichum graminicola]
MCGWERGPCNSARQSLSFVSWSLCQSQINYPNIRSVQSWLLKRRLLYSTRKRNQLGWQDPDTSMSGW